MKNGDYDKHKVSGLGFGITAYDNYGWVILTEDRSLTTDFYKWFVIDCLVGAVQSIRQCFNLPVSKNMSFLQVDGEDVQIKAFLDKDIRRLLKENNIHVGKSCQSSTEIEQECDAGNVFKAPKTRLKSLKFTHVDRKTDLYIQLKSTWALHQRICGTTITANHTKSGVDGLVLIHHSVQDSYTQPLIKNCFVKTGSNPFLPEVMMDNCFAEFKLREIRLLLSNLDYLKSKIDDKGEYFDEDLDLVGIEKNINKTAPKENLALFKRRAVLLTHDRVPEKFQEMSEEKLMMKCEKESAAYEKSMKQKIAAEEKVAKAERQAARRVINAQIQADRKQKRILAKQARQAALERKRAYMAVKKAATLV
jgi:hypothetical protein